jgi:hypothetical protein
LNSSDRHFDCVHARMIETLDALSHASLFIDYGRAAQVNR